MPDRGRSAVRLDDRKARLSEFVPDSLLQQPEVLAHHGREIGVHDRRIRALVFTVFRAHVARDADQEVRKARREYRRGALFVGGVEKREKEADRDRFDAFARENIGGGVNRGLVQRHQYRSRGIESLHRLQTAVPRNQRDGAIDREVVQAFVRPHHAADFEEVAESRRGKKPDPGTGAFDQRVSSSGGSVHHLIDVRGSDPGRRRDRMHAVHHAVGAVGRRGRHLDRDEPPAAAIGQHGIGEGTTDVDCNAITSNTKPPVVL